MKKLVLTALLASLLLLSPRPAHAGMPVFFSFGGEKIIKVASLPDTDDFKDKEGKHFDVGYRYKQVTLFFMPVWNYDEQWCGYLGNSDYYLKLDKPTLDVLAGTAALKLPEQASIPFWDQYGGKAAVIALFVLMYFVGKYQQEQEAKKSLS